ncbi:MAG: hypothetical protein N3D12_04125 [Candidatus Methanomethyliaceae archaeon]|nr:hypothetical protein [Candidatus Methanomethyliaceae archaeon]
MREFALLVPSKIISSEELGIVTRFVVGSMLLSHGVRPDSRAHIIFDEKICITFDGKSMRNVRPDEQSLAGILRAGLERGAGRVMMGISAKRIDIDEFLSGVRGAKIYYSGAYGRVEDVPQDFFSVFGYPNLGIKESLCKSGFLSVNLGSVDLLPDQAVVVLNNRVDRKLRRINN